MYEPRLDPAAWNKHFQDRKSLRFSADSRSRNPDLFAETRGQEPQRRTLTQVMKKYSNVDPIQLIRKYQKNKTTLPPTISRKYPTYFTSKKDDADKDEYSKYTTASSFRNANKSAAIGSQPTLAPSSRERFGSKLFDAQSIKISPKLTSIRDNERTQSENEKNRNHNTLGRVALFMCNVKVYLFVLWFQF